MTASRLCLGSKLIARIRADDSDELDPRRGGNRVARKLNLCQINEANACVAAESLERLLGVRHGGGSNKERSASCVSWNGSPGTLRRRRPQGQAGARDGVEQIRNYVARSKERSAEQASLRRSSTRGRGQQGGDS